MQAIRDVIRSLRNEGWSTQDLAERLDVSPPTVSRWETMNRAPSLDLLPRFDALLGRPRGEVLRRAGYVDDIDVPDVEAAIRSDHRLGAREREAALDFFDYLVRRSEGSVASAKASAR